MSHNMLVSTQWLEAHLEDPDLRIFDCTGSLGEHFVNRGKEKQYDIHHIPGAAYLDIASPKGELADENAPLPFTWPSQEKFERVMAEKGVSNSSRVILYGAANPDTPDKGEIGISWITRAWWLMHHFGVDCAILDGGWQKWVRENRPVSAEERIYPPAEFNAHPDWHFGLVQREQVLSAIGRENICIVDSLSPESYRGESDKQYGDFGTRKGHITSARNVHFEQMVDPDTLCFREPESLRAIFDRAGVDLDQDIITYCGGGVGATMTGFGLKRLGCDRVAIYDASMMEWNGDPSLPMTNPSEAKTVNAG